MDLHAETFNVAQMIGEVASTVAPVVERNANRFERVVADGSLSGVDYLNVNGSMKNGGGPACLRLRVPLSELHMTRLGGSVLFDERCERELENIIKRRYREQLTLEDVADPQLVDEARTALDEVTQVLGLGSVYDFQR